MIQFQQTLSDKDYKRAYIHHSFSYKSTYNFCIIGVLLTLITLGFCIFVPNFFDYSVVFILIICIYLVLRPLRLANIWIKSLKTSKLYSETSIIQITDDDKIITNLGGNSSSTLLKDMFAYLNKKDYLLLYISRNQFCIFSKKHLSSVQVEYIINRLINLGIKRL